MKKILNVVLLTAALFLWTGATCNNARLETGGAYAPVGQQADIAFYSTDAAYDLAYTAIDTIFTFERNNRDALWKISPDIKHTLDGLRPQAWEVNKQYHVAREAYKKVPVPDNLTVLQQVLAKMQKLLAAANAVVPKQ